MTKISRPNKAAAASASFDDSLLLTALARSGGSNLDRATLRSADADSDSDDALELVLAEIGVGGGFDIEL